MRYSYGLAIRTFNGAQRVEELIKSLPPFLSTFSDKVIVEDFCPEGHERMMKAARSFPDWRLISCSDWINMQGTAQRAMKECNADFVFLMSDDLLSTGNPFRNSIKFLENCSEDISKITGALALPHYDAEPDLVRVEILEQKGDFYTKLGGKRLPPVHYNSRIVNPSMGEAVHGAAYLLNKKAWEHVGGYDPRWHADDQQISYKIWLNSPYIIYTMPGDPFLHMGGMAQAAGFHYDEAVRQGDFERCGEIFGGTYEEVRQKVFKVIHEKALKYQESLVNEFNRIGFAWRFI